MTPANLILRFSVIVLSSREIGKLFSTIRLPLISGYLFAGIIMGPFVLELITGDGVEDLRFLDEVSLGYIAFAAGSEMYLRELKGRLRSIFWNTLLQLVAVYFIGGAAFLLLADSIPFMEGLSASGQMAAAILGATILVARSPSSAIAIINELRARGPFTKTVLGVTLVKDVIVVVLFALSTSVASTLLQAETFDVSFVFIVGLELTLSFLGGYLLGRLLAAVLARHLVDKVKIALILLAGYGVFVMSAKLRHFTHDALPFEILVEPLLICMFASFWLTNYSPYRDEFRFLLRIVELPVFVIFFTLIGAALDIGILVTILPLTIALFTVRLIGLYIGGFIGGTLAGDPPEFNHLTWLAYITQAGVGLGLAKEVAIEFPQLGDDFTTVLVAVIVLSQLVGPPFFKYATKRVGEAHIPTGGDSDRIRDALIIGVENQSYALAQQLQSHNWQVILAETDPAHVTNRTEESIRVHLLPEISVKHIREIAKPGLDAVVAMLHDDGANLKLCELIYEEFASTRIVVRLNDYAYLDRFREINAVVVYPATAMVHLLDNVVRTPQLATLLMHDDPQNEIVQITIADPDIHGRPLRDLVLPTDVLVMAIKRDGQSIMPHGYTELHLNDEVTLVGVPASLEEATLKLGY